MSNEHSSTTLYHGIPRAPEGSGGTPARSFRVPDVLWDAAKAKAHGEGASLTYVLVRYLQDYVRD